jgi:putative SOS response-associated peptidase YedK
MCGRVSQVFTRKDVAEQLGLADVPELFPRYNVAPTAPILAVRRVGEGRESSLLRWGLVPPWSAGPLGKPLFNARADTAATKPAFRAAFKSRRCVVPVSGYYEWPAKDRPVYIHPVGSPLLALAGIWERWQGPDGEHIESCAILTTEASDAVRVAHERMPCILSPKDLEDWLNPTSGADVLLPLLRPCEQVAFYPVSVYVNSARNQGPRCAEPVAA